MGLFDEKPVTTPSVDGPVINLRKSEAISLKKKAPSLKRAYVGLGWDAKRIKGAKINPDTKKPYEHDLDVVVYMNNSEGFVYALPDGFIYYDHTDDKARSVHHTGDNIDGEGEGDDEAVIIDLTKVPAGVHELAIIATIYDATEREQNFGQVDNAFIRVCDDESAKNPEDKREIVRFDLTDEYSTALSVIFAKFTRRENGEWEFKAIGDGKVKELAEICAMYGVKANNQ